VRFFLGLAVAIVIATACTKPPKPRVFPPKGTPQADATHGKRDSVSDTPSTPPTSGTNPGGTTGSSSDTTDGRANPTLTPTQDVVVPPAPPSATATATATAAATATSTAAAPSIKVRATTSGGYFDNCVWARAHGGAFTELGCTKKKPASATACVGPDTTFLSAKSLPVKGAVVQKLALQIETYHPTSPGTTCNAAAGTFAYDFVRGGHETWSSTAGRQPDHALCKKGKLPDGTTRIKVCYEDSTDKDFSNVVLVIDAVGVDISLDNLACDDTGVILESLTLCK